MQLSRQTVVEQDGNSIFGRILAKENLTINYDIKAKTGSFNLKTKVITIPVFNEKDDKYRIWFTAHEISHSIYTPPKEYLDGCKDLGNSDVLNVTEDARIEKLIIRKYPGLQRASNLFYKNMIDDTERNFFGIKNQDLSKLNLATKINLHFKIGKFVKIPFLTEELKYVAMVEKEETIQDAIEAAREILKYMLDKGQASEVKVGGFSFSEDGDSSSDDNSTPQEGEPDLTGNISIHDLGDKIKQRIKFDTKSIDKAHDNSTFFRDTKGTSIGDVYNDKNYKKYIYDLSVIKRVSNNYILEIAPVVNMMVQQFLIKQNARDYEKSAYSKSGNLDMKKIVNYKWKEDIFLKKEVVFGKQSHGFVMFVDCSASMSSVITQTMKQVIILTEFCRRLRIPFEVYGFKEGNYNSHTPTSNGLYSSTCTSNFYKLLSSEMKVDEYKKRVNNMTVDFTSVLSLGGTNLYHTAFMTEYVTRDFINKHQCDKNILILLSDGQPTDSLTFNDKSVNPSQLILKNHQKLFYSYENNPSSYFHTIFSYVKDKLNLHKTIGFYLTPSMNDSIISFISPWYKDKELSKNNFNTKGFYNFESTKGFDNFYAVSLDKFNKKSTNSFVFLKNFIDQIS